MFDLRQHVVHRDDAVWSGAARIVDDGSVRLHPDPAAGARQEPVVTRRHLALAQHWNRKREFFFIRFFGKCLGMKFKFDTKA